MTDASRKKQGILRQDKLVVFEDKNIRRSFHKGEWYFSIIDIVRVLSGSSDPSRYWTELRTQLADSEGFVQLFGEIYLRRYYIYTINKINNENYFNQEA